MQKVRFGISIPKELAEDVNEISEALGVDRSMVVRSALEEHVNLYKHSTVEHDCIGVLLTFSREETPVELPKVIDEFKDLVANYSHSHVKCGCMNVIIVQGPSRKVMELHKKLCSLKLSVRFIPVGHD